MKYSKLILTSFSLLLLLLAIFPVVRVKALTPVPPSDDQVNAIAHKLFCPICENTPLDVCPTEACRQWREQIRQMLMDGKTEDQIIQYFIDNYGVRVVGTPPRSGINWLAYIIPPVVFLAGAFLLFQAFRTWRKLPKESSARENDLEDTSLPVKDVEEKNSERYKTLIEEELKKRRY